MHLVSLAAPPDMRGVRGWRAATSAPLTYRIGASSLHFRSHLLLAATRWFMVKKYQRD